MAVSILSACGYSAVECGSGVQCIDFLDHEVPALILLDISMPDIDGFDLLRQIRQRHAADAVPVLLVTASAEGKDVVRGLTTGANDYLVKPLDRTAFLARVYNHISLSQIRRQSEEDRLKVSSLVNLRRAIEELNQEVVFVQREDGSLLYCNDLLGKFIEGAPALRAEEIASRLLSVATYTQLRDALRENPRAVVQREVELPFDVSQHGYQQRCRVRTAMHGDARIWVLQLESKA
jgi:CheY-like chemotaxis protein